MSSGCVRREAFWGIGRPLSTSLHLTRFAGIFWKAPLCFYASLCLRMSVSSRNLKAILVASGDPLMSASHGFNYPWVLLSAGVWEQIPHRYQGPTVNNIHCIPNLMIHPHDPIIAQTSAKRQCRELFSSVRLSPISQHASHSHCICFQNSPVKSKMMLIEGGFLFLFLFFRLHTIIKKI